MACFYLKSSMAFCIPTYVFRCDIFHWCFVCMLKNHSESSVADLIFPLILPGSEPPAVILLYRGGAGSLSSDTACVSIYFWPFASGKVLEKFGNRFTIVRILQSKNYNQHKVYNKGLQWSSSYEFMFALRLLENHSNGPFYFIYLVVQGNLDKWLQL